jgi:hypothetical protein
MYFDHLVIANANPTMWLDTRPTHLAQLTQEELESGSFTTWDDGDYRLVRALTISPFTIDRVAQLARQLGVVRIGRPGKVLKATALNSQFWEAVGLGWLTPRQAPTAPKWKSRVRKQFQDLEW